MIIVNYYHDKDYNPSTDGFQLYLEGVVNDVFDLYSDPNLIQEAVENDPDFKPKHETLYEIQLIRGMVSADPIPEPCFVIDKVVEKVFDENHGWQTPLVKL